MMKCIFRIDWEDASEALPAPSVPIFMPVTYSLATGFATGAVELNADTLPSSRGPAGEVALFRRAVARAGVQRSAVAERR